MLENPKKFPVGTQRTWESTGQVWVKTHDNGPMDDIVGCWMPLPSIPKSFLDKFRQLDTIGREIFSYKQPIEGDLWLDYEFEDFKTRTDKKFSPADFKKFFWGTQRGYDFYSELSRRFIDDKIEFNAYLAELMLSKNEEKKYELAEKGEDIGTKSIFLTKEEIAIIKKEARDSFKYDENDRLVIEDVEDIEVVLDNIIKYLRQGENFEGEEKLVYEKAQKFLERLDQGPYVNIHETKSEMREIVSEMNTTFSKAWGIRNTFIKKLDLTFSGYIRKYQRDIEADMLKTFKEQVKVDLHAPTKLFYDTIEDVVSEKLKSINIQDYIGKLVPLPSSKLKDGILEGVEFFTEKDRPYVIIKDSITGKSIGQFVDLESYKQLLFSNDSGFDVDIPLKIRLSQNYDKDLIGNYDFRDLKLCRVFEELTSFLPSGHLLTNKYVQSLRKEGRLSNSDNSYAHFDYSNREIYFSEKAIKESSRGFTSDYLTSGKSEVATVLIHEVGHAVSKKLGQRNSRLYKNFVYECGWSWEQFPDRYDNKSYTATGHDPDIKRHGTNSERPLITQYAAKSPEEAFAEYYSFYTQHRGIIDKYLETNNPKLLAKSKSIELGKQSESKSSFKDFVNSTPNNIEGFNSMESTIISANRKIDDHIRIGVIDPYYDKLDTLKESDVNIGHIIHKKSKHSTNYNTPTPILSIFDYETGKQDIINTQESDDVGIHYANKYLRRLTPTVSISKEVYNLLQDRGYTYSQIRGFAFYNAREHTIPDVRQSNITTNTLEGLLYRGQLVDREKVREMKPILKVMKSIWESEDLKKSLRDLFNMPENNNLMKSKSYFYEYITVTPEGRKPFKRLQRKRVRDIDSSDKKEKKVYSSDYVGGLVSKLISNKAIKYKGDYYYREGSKIHIPQELRTDIDSSYDSKTLAKWGSIDDTDRKLKEKELQKETRSIISELEPTINRKNQLFELYLEKEKEKHNSMNTIDSRRNRVEGVLGSITQTSTISDILRNMGQVSNMLDADINPSLIISYKGKEHERDLDALVTSLESKDDKSSRLGIQGIKIKDLDSYTDTDFRHLELDIYSDKVIQRVQDRVNKQFKREKDRMDKSQEIEEFDSSSEVDDIVEQVLIESERIEKSESTNPLQLFKETVETLKNIFSGVKQKSKDKHQKYGDVVVQNTRGQILLLQRNAYDDFMPSKWALPGGKVEEGESFLQGATRELSEETGLTFSESQLQELEILDKPDCTIGYFYVLVNGQDPMILDNEEHYHYQWVDLADIDQYDMIFDLCKQIKSFKLPIIPLSVLSLQTPNYLGLLSEHEQNLHSTFEAEEITSSDFYKGLEKLKRLRDQYNINNSNTFFDTGDITTKDFFDKIRTFG
jgi:8-oxo-dGTP pyrophosphatase MutT (NUDIX family)